MLEQLPALPHPSHRPVRILQITDLHHFGVAEGHTYFQGPRVVVPILGFTAGDELKAEVSPGGYSVGRGIALIARLIATQRPTLVVFSGDIIDGRMCENHLRAMREVVQPCVLAGVPWCFTPGNHDDDEPCPWSHSDLLQIMTLPGCATPQACSFDHTFMVGEGVRLFFFDTHGSAKTSKDGVTARAVAGYEELSVTPALVFERDRGVVGLSYFHIPLPEYAEESSAVVSGHLDSLAPMRSMLPAKMKGRRIVGCPRTNTGLYSALCRRGNVVATFCGHDHYHDCVLRKEPAGSDADAGRPFLAYGRVAAFTPPADFEGAGGALPFDRGGRVVEIAQDGQTETWIAGVSGEEAGSRLFLKKSSRL